MHLYPLIFEPIFKKVIWGGNRLFHFKGVQPVEDGVGESWEISCVKQNVSVVANGEFAGQKLDELIATYKDRFVGKSVYELHGTMFPLLIKFIDAQDNLSIQVHPDDALAKQRHDSFGKTEMWYVVDAAPGAFLYCGFEKEMTPEQYPQTVKDNTFTDYLAKHDVKKGDVFFLPAGRVHAIGAGALIAEIQQTSDITYRIYDFNRKDANGNSRELHTELAKDAIDYTIHSEYRNSYKENRNEPVELESCKYFTTNLLELDQVKKRDYSKTDSFVIYMCISGSCELVDNNDYKITVHQGQTVLIPAEIDSITIKPNAKALLLEVYL